MGTTLTGTTPQDTYDSLIKVTDNGPISGTAKYLSDGLGNDSVLALSTAGVGIGTTSLAATLDIRKDSGVYELVKIQNASAGALYRAVGAGGGTVDFGADDALASTAIFRTAGSERMRITSTGRVGIGTTATSTAGNPLLQVNGSVSKETTAGSIAVSTPTTIFTLPNNGVFLVTTKQNDDVGTRSTAHLIFTETSGTVTRQVDLATGTDWTVTMSGLSVVLTNTSAFTRGYSASVLQLF